MGLSFAIPIDVAMDIQQQLRTVGKVTRGRIGVGTACHQRRKRSLSDCPSPPVRW
jgi:S1-C subfamily serine protease